MDKLSYLNRGKNLLRSIKSQREYLLRHGKGYVPTDFAKKELANIENALVTIASSDQMRQYLQLKAPELRILMPARNRKRHNELRELLEN